MIKEQSFEWLLEGCHRIADVAVAYYPNYAYACSAVKALRRSIAEHACLLKDLTDQGYTARTAHLTPVQIGILLSYWGIDVYKRQGSRDTSHYWWHHWTLPIWRNRDTPGRCVRFPLPE